MILVTAKVGPFKSIDKPQTVQLDEAVTVFVGMNEAGKTIFLKALEKSRDAVGIAKFEHVDDFPRKDLSDYLGEHEKNPATATVLTYQLTADEIQVVNKEFGVKLPPNFQFSVTRKYSNTLSIGIEVDEKPVIAFLLRDAQLSGDAVAAIKPLNSVRAIPAALKTVNLTEGDKAFLAGIEKRLTTTYWGSVVQWEIWKSLERRIPKFAYFGDYDLLPSKMNLHDLVTKVEQAKSNPKILTSEHRAILALLRKAGISLGDLTEAGGYETLKAKIEGVSISLTNRVMKYWKQNEDLEVEVDVKPDTTDDPPFNNGPNLYLRIKNLRHRGVSTPFRHRSKGFIWFFSFIVWFEDVQKQIEVDGKPKDYGLVLLLDEPGLSLHALAQEDFLEYIDVLAEKQQVLYTTHSPFMVHSDRLDQVRLVEDKPKIGTVISQNVSGSDPRTIFPLKAGLGWTIAQNLFITERNLIVEGTSDMIYLDAFSEILESHGREGLREDVTICPTGGVDKIVTFVALLGANDLQLAVLHDYRGTDEQKLMDLVKEKIISSKAILNASQFRETIMSGKPSDIEDILGSTLYLEYFNRTFSEQLNGAILLESELPPGDRIIDRIEKALVTKSIQLRPSGGFNHHRVATYFASHPPAQLDLSILSGFENLFKKVNGLFDAKVSQMGKKIKRRIEPVIKEAIEEVVLQEDTH